MCVNVCIYVYICICIYIYIYNTYVYIYIHMCREGGRDLFLRLHLRTIWQEKGKKTQRSRWVEKAFWPDIYIYIYSIPPESTKNTILVHICTYLYIVQIITVERIVPQGNNLYHVHLGINMY